MAISTARILVSNDDGIHAPGIAVLENIARTLSDDVWVVAPDSERSGAGHSLTLTNPIRIRKAGDKRYAVSGTPTDCVMMAVNHIMRDTLPTLILSGVNRGGNLAEDVGYSGTVSVAAEGCLAGIPSIALSQCLRPQEPALWDTAERYAGMVIRDLIDGGWPEDVLMNVNFPACAPDAVKGVHVTVQGRRQIIGNNVEERVDPRGFPYFWFGLGRDVGVPGLETDLHAVRGDYISVTPLHLDRTHYESREALADRISREFSEA